MARGKRYSRILEAAKYYSSIDNYIKYITDASKRGSKVGQGDPRPPSQRLFIDPFNILLSGGQLYPTTAAQPSWTRYKPNFGTHTKDAPPANEALIVKLGNFTPARVIVSTGRSNTGVAKTSKVTGLRYLSYGGKSTSVPFGRKDETETQETAFNEIRNAILTSTPGAIVTLQPEKF